MSHRILAAAAVVLFALTGCPEDKKEGASGGTAAAPLAAKPAAPTENGAPAAAAPVAAAPVAAAPADPKAEAAELFKGRCAACHGLAGKGDGPASVALNPKPRNYTDAKWQAQVTDEHIEKTIVEGGAAVGLSPLMVPNADLANKPEVVKQLRTIIRAFGGK